MAGLQWREPFAASWSFIGYVEMQAFLVNPALVIAMSGTSFSDPHSLSLYSSSICLSLFLYWLIDIMGDALSRSVLLYISGLFKRKDMAVMRRSFEKAPDTGSQKPAKTGGESSKQWLGGDGAIRNDPTTPVDKYKEEGDNHIFTTKEDYDRVQGKATLYEKRQFVEKVDADLIKIDAIIKKNSLKRTDIGRDSRYVLDQKIDLIQRRRGIQYEITELEELNRILEENSARLRESSDQPLQPADRYKKEGDDHTYSTKDDFEHAYNRVKGQGNDGVEIDIEDKIKYGEQYQQRLRGDIQKINDLLKNLPYLRKTLGAMGDVEEQRNEYVKRHDKIEKEISPLLERAGKAPGIGLSERRGGDMIVEDDEYLRVRNNPDPEAKKEILEVMQLHIERVHKDMQLPDSRSSRGYGGLVEKRERLQKQIEEIQWQLDNPGQPSIHAEKTNRWLNRPPPNHFI